MEFDTIYDESFSEEFNNPDFYASPKKTKINLRIGNDEHLVGNSIVFNIETSNEKIPVYAYNSSLYAKYLKGKSIITGMIALRKTTVDRIVSMIKLNDGHEDYIRELEKIDISITILEQMVNEGDNTDEDTEKFLELIYRKNALKKELTENKEKYFRTGTGYDLTDDMQDLLWVRENTNDDEISFRLEYESELADREENIKDVLFIKRSQDVSIDKQDIIEIYQFIGNPKEYLTK
ncbi:MAG: hypothetical protein ACRCXX_14195 [Cetobacterium sp.]|uniref:hypothetical protein n=1 Tax=Cetobacterium sp. TaxID=2071632 RepID=UPI003F32A371